MLLIKNVRVFSPENEGLKDILVGAGKILAVEKNIHPFAQVTEVWEAGGKIITPGFIDQHIHITGAGGKHGFQSLTPELTLSELIACGTTTVVGLLGTDGSIRGVNGLYGKACSLQQEGLSAYMYTGYYGLDPNYITGSVRDDMIFVDKVLGCKIAIGDIRSSYPTAHELLRILREVRVGGMMAGKKGVLHIHLGNLPGAMDVLFDIVQNHHFPISHLSPTHVGRTRDLFDQALAFARLGGMIDITTGASKFTDPYLSVLEALEKGIPMDRLTFSSDGNAGLEKMNDYGEVIGFRRAPIDANFKEVVRLHQDGGLPFSEALKLVTVNPANNLGISHKGRIKPGSDADFCCLDDQFHLTDVWAGGKRMMKDGKIIQKGGFE